jgi:hypothetical protein
MSEWTLSLVSATSGALISTITLAEDGTVTTTGSGVEDATVKVNDGRKQLFPSDGLPWLVALAEEMGRSGYTIATIEGPGD